MDNKEILLESFRIVKFTLYPILQLYGYFVFVGLFCLEDEKFERWYVLVFFLLYHILTTTKVVFYMKVLVNEGCSTVEMFPNVPTDAYNLDLKGFNVFLEEEITRKNLGKVKSCNKCKTYKPPRAHHCSSCNRCFLKFDHHCEVLDTCIGFHNYKFFYQFLILNFITTMYFITIVGIKLILGVEKNYLRINYIVSISLFSISFVWTLVMLIIHFRLISNNETTVENKALNEYIEGISRYAFVFQEGPITTLSNSKDRKLLNPYNLGMFENWKQVFGENIYDWFKPNFSSVGDGTNFPKNYTDYDLV